MLDKSEENVIDDIAAYGWHVINVMENEKGPGFCYSVGMMETLDHPEVIMFGMKANLMGNLINSVGAFIRGGRRFAADCLYEDLLEGYACKCVNVDPRWHSEYLGFAMWHRRHVGKMGDLQAVQLLWPDRAGIFPDEKTCHPEVVRRQPLLSRSS